MNDSWDEIKKHPLVVDVYLEEDIATVCFILNCHGHYASAPEGRRLCKRDLKEWVDRLKEALK